MKTRRRRSPKTETIATPVIDEAKEAINETVNAELDKVEKTVGNITDTFFEKLREAGNIPLVRAFIIGIFMGSAIFAGLNANGNASEALSTSKRARNIAVDAEDQAIAAQKRADANKRQLERQDAFAKQLAAERKSLDEGIERAVQRGVIKGVAIVLERMGLEE